MSAEDGYFYGTNNLQNRVFERVNIADGTVETITDRSFSGNSVATFAIDVRRDHYTYSAGLDQLVKLDLHTGEVVSEESIGQSNLNGLHYDYGSDSYYSVYEEDGPKLLKINAADNSTQRVNLAPGPSRVDVCSTLLDGARGWLMILASSKTLYVYNIANGAKLYEHQLEDTYIHPVFNPADQHIYALKLPFGGTSKREFDLAKIDPLRGRVTLQEIAGSNLRDLAVAGCSKGIHVNSGTYCVALPGGLMYINIDVPNFRWYTAVKGRDAGGSVMYNLPASVFEADGRVYYDANQNCVFDADEDVLAGRFVDIEPGGLRVRSGDDGQFTLRLEPGTYTATLETDETWSAACNTAAQEFTVKADGSLDAPLDLGLFSELPISQLDLNISQTRAVAGSTTRYVVNYLNRGNIPFSGTLQFKHDAIVTNLLAIPAADRYADALAEWDLKSLAVGAAGQIVIDLDIADDETLIGREICASIEIAGEIPEEWIGERRADVCTQIIASFAPNSISVSPRGTGERGLITRKDSVLTYTIHFQNLGNSAVSTVIINDTLDPKLDLTSFRLGAASHDYAFNMVGSNILEFRFDDINLPGSEVDEANSQGFISFRVNVNRNLMPGVEIFGRAAIYFDFTQRVVTNTVINTISDDVTDVVAHREPDQLELRSLGNAVFVLQRAANAASVQSATVKVYSALGSKVFESSLKATGATTIDLSSQPSGRYLIHVENGTASIVKSIAVIR